MIREAKEQDYKKIYKLGSILHHNYENIYNLKELNEKSYFKVLVYEQEKTIVGFLMFSEVEDTIDVIDIVVEEKERRKKVASCLMDYMITNSTPGGRIYLEVSINNLKAIQMYEKFNFKKIHIRKNYYGKEDAFVMERVNEDE